MPGAVERIEAALRERYNVDSLEGLGPFPAALAAARAGDSGPLREAVASREMYRWAPAIEESLAALEAAGSTGEVQEPAPHADAASAGDVAISLAGNVTTVTERIEATTDPEALRAAAEAEAAQEKPRKTVLAAIEARLATLEAGDSE